MLLVASLIATVALGVTVFAAPQKFSLDNMEIKWSDEFNGTELNR